MRIWYECVTVHKWQFCYGGVVTSFAVVLQCIPRYGGACPGVILSGTYQVYLVT